MAHLTTTGRHLVGQQAPDARAQQQQGTTVVLGRDEVDQQAHPVVVAHALATGHLGQTVQGQVQRSHVEAAISHERGQRPQGAAVPTGTVNHEQANRRVRTTGAGDMHPMPVPVPPRGFRLEQAVATSGRQEADVGKVAHPRHRSGSGVSMILPVGSLIIQDADGVTR